MLDALMAIHNNVTKHTPLTFKRSLHETIDWKAKRICITGARGVGKTTLLLQHYHENFGNAEKCLYISADNVEVSASGLFAIATEYFGLGGEAIIIDEVHKYSNWQQEVKNISDTFPGKTVFISGSSSLDLKKGKADLSRRFAFYDLKGLSFREYLHLKESRTFPVLSIEDVLDHHLKHAQKLSSQFSVLKSFRAYVTSGYYPFFMEGESTYLQKIQNVIEKVLYEDIPTITNIKTSNIPYLKKILWIIATSSPFSTNIEKLSRDLGISKEYVYHYLEYLETAGLLVGLRANARGFKLVRKPTKLLIENTNLLLAIGHAAQTEAEQGTLRETFFVNQLKQVGNISSAEQGDFIFNGKITFEIGGPSKDRSQLKGLKNAFVAADRIEIGAGNKIPLYLFGFLY